MPSATEIRVQHALVLTMERVALLGAGAALALIAQRVLSRMRAMRSQRLQFIWRPAGSTAAGLSLEITAAPSQCVGSEILAFIREGFAGIQEAEGKKATERELAEIEQTAKKGLGTVLTVRTRDTHELCGYLWFMESSSCPYGPADCYARRARPYLWVHTIYTSPKFRRQGIAKALYKHLDDVCARAHGCSEVWLDVYNVNPTSEKTHRALGAVPVTQIYKRKVGAD